MPGSKHLSLRSNYILMKVNSGVKRLLVNPILHFILIILFYYFNISLF
jgi:hypothetical protein